MEMESTCLDDYPIDLLGLKICEYRIDRSFPFLKPEGLNTFVAFSETPALFFKL